MSSKNLEAAGYSKGFNFDRAEQTNARTVATNVLSMFQKPGYKPNFFDIIVAGQAQKFLKNNPGPVMQPEPQRQINWGTPPNQIANQPSFDWRRYFGTF